MCLFVTIKMKIDKKAFYYPEDFIKILNLASEKQKFTLNCMINTGARINEIYHAELKDLDNERKNLYLRITKTKAMLGEKKPSPRIIVLSNKFYNYFKKNKKHFLILSRNATRIMMQKFNKKIGLNNYKDYSSHNLRKTFGSWMLSLGVDGFKLAQHLGHSTEMLRTHYASPDIFNIKDKLIMKEILDNLPERLGAR